MKEKEFIPKEWVLVRPDSANKWCLARFSHLDNGVYMSVGGIGYPYCIPYNEETKNLLGTTDDYEEPYEPKDGDFCVADDSKDSTIFVYNEKYSNPKYFGTYIGLYRGRNDLSLWKSDAWCDRHRKLRLATEEEKQLLLSKLEEIGKKWNAEKKCIEDVWVPKDGDFAYVVCKSGSRYTFIKKKHKDITDCYVALDWGTNTVFDSLGICFDKNIKIIRSATEEEKHQLLDAMHKEGKGWDAEKKEIVNYKWKPKHGEIYWYIDDTLCILSSQWFDSSFDKCRHSFGNCFNTEEEAKLMADKFKKLLKGE